MLSKGVNSKCSLTGTHRGTRELGAGRLAGRVLVFVWLGVGLGLRLV